MLIWQGCPEHYINSKWPSGIGGTLCVSFWQWEQVRVPDIYLILTTALSDFSTINSEVTSVTSSTQLCRFDMVARIAIHGLCGQVVSAVHTVSFVTSERRFEPLTYTFFNTTASTKLPSFFRILYSSMSPTPSIFFHRSTLMGWTTVDGQWWHGELATMRWITHDMENWRPWSDVLDWHRPRHHAVNYGG